MQKFIREKMEEKHFIYYKRSYEFTNCWYSWKKLYIRATFNYQIIPVNENEKWCLPIGVNYIIFSNQESRKKGNQQVYKATKTIKQINNTCLEHLNELLKKKGYGYEIH